MRNFNRAAAWTASFVAVMLSMGCGGQGDKAQKHLPQPVLTVLPAGAGRFLDSIPVIYLVATIYNPGSDTLRFQSMSCSYEDYFLTDRPGMPVQSRWDCLKNGPASIVLPPGKRTDRNLMLRYDGNMSGLTAKPLRLGMYLQPAPGSLSVADGCLPSKKEDCPVLWSDTVSFARLLKATY